MAAGKLGDGAVAGFTYRTHIQKLLDRGHSVDTVVRVHEEFLMHLHKHDSFNVAGDTVLGKSLFQSLCADLPPPSSTHARRNSGGSSTRGSQGSGQRAGRAPSKDGCYTRRGEHFAVNCPGRKGGSRGRGNHSIGQGGHGSSFPAAPTPRAGETDCMHLKGSPCRSVSQCGRQAMIFMVAMVQSMFVIESFIIVLLMYP